MSPVWLKLQLRFAVESARFSVFWHTTRTGVIAALMAPLPSWAFMNTRYGEISSPLMMYWWGSLASTQVRLPPWRLPAVS